MKQVSIRSDRELDVLVAEQFGWQGPVLWLDEEDSPVDRPTDQHPADPYMFPPGIVPSDDRTGDRRVPHLHEHPYWNLLCEEMSSRGFKSTSVSLDSGYLAVIAVSFDGVHVVRGYNKDRILTQLFLLTRGIEIVAAPTPAPAPVQHCDTSEHHDCLDCSDSSCWNHPDNPHYNGREEDANCDQEHTRRMIEAGEQLPSCDEQPDQPEETAHGDGPEIDEDDPDA